MEYRKSSMEGMVKLIAMKENMVSNLIDSYKGKTVLVTGHTGFKGSWMSIWLNQLGAKVVGYSLDPYTNQDNFVLSGIGEKIVDLRGDIRDEESLLNVFLKYKPEIVFHFAAQPIVSTSYISPRETYEINIMGTVNLLECVRKTNSAKVIIIITSDKCYENKEWIWGYRENDLLGGYDPYSSSKAGVEIVTAAYRNSYFKPDNFKLHGKALATVRAGNVIGGGDWSKDRIIPDCIRALTNGTEIGVRNPTSIRPWQHVLEPLYGYLLLASKMLKDGIKYSEAWNFGPDPFPKVPVKDIVMKIINLWGSGDWSFALEDLQIKHETNTLFLDCNKAKNLLGWYPKLTIDEVIRLTMEWYKNYKLTDINELCLEQINGYMKGL
jgi:CDP-glucose 4,6-dehydratase